MHLCHLPNSNLISLAADRLARVQLTKRIVPGIPLPLWKKIRRAVIVPTMPTCLPKDPVVLGKNLFALEVRGPDELAIIRFYKGETL